MMICRRGSPISLNLKARWMTELKGDVGELAFTVQVTRKETGKVEEYRLVGKITDEQLKELTNGSDTLNGSTQRGD